MSRLIKKVSKTAGLIPGTLIHVGNNNTSKVKITIIDYNENEFHEKEAKSVEECFPLRDSDTVSWINVDGVHDTDIVEKLGDHFGIHSLALEDIVNTAQRPKCDDFESYLFLVIKMLYRDSGTFNIISEQVSMVIGKNFVISFQEMPGDVFEAVRERIRKAKGRIRKAGADYLAYALIDAVVDNYFAILEALGEKIEDMEEALIRRPAPKTLQTIQYLKRDALFLRKSVWPLREAISSMVRGESTVIKKTSIIYLRDVYDHTIQVIDTIEACRDMISGMIDIYLSSISNRMNEVMKVLTIFAAIFIPLTFIAGVYGMNFKYMPELEWHYGYFMILGLMVAIAGSLIIFFKRKKWF